MAEDIDGLRAKLAGMRGPVRTYPLHELARLLTDRYWRTGPGKPEAVPDLHEATEALTEAYGYFEPGDELRGFLAVQLGWLLATRHTVHGGPESDRETGIDRLVEGMNCPRQPPAVAPVTQFMLGQLYLSRVTGGFVQGAMTLAVRPGKGSPKQADDARRAAECFRQVLAAPSLGPQVTAGAEAMLTLAEALVSMFGGVPGFDPRTVTRAAQALHRLRKQAGPLLSMGSRMADMDPLDRPVVVMDGSDAPPARPPATPRPRPAAPVTDTDALRHALRERLGTDADACAAAGALLADGAPPTDVDTADELVALATTVVHTGPAVATDHLLLAVALMLRGRADDGPTATADADAALDSVRAAAADVRSLPPPAFTLLLRLSIHLAHRDTAGTFRRTLAEIASALRSVGADALACPLPTGMVLLHAASGRVSLGTERTLPRRTLVVGDRPPAAGIAIVSTLASHAQLLDLAGRRRRAATEEPVFVVDARERAATEVEPLKRCYPRGEILAGGTASAVLARRGAAMLHLACPVSPDGALRLAAGTELCAEAIAAAGPSRPGGGLVVLPAAGTGFPKLADAFLTTGCTGVIGWLRPVPPRVASAAYLALHTRLARQPQEPAAVVHAVRRWLRDPDRKPLPGFTADLAAVDTRDVAAALVHRGI